MKGWVPVASALLVLCPTLLSSEVPREAPAALNSTSRISPPQGGWFPWYEIHVDPQDGNHLVVCGSRWDSGKNALYGFVYSSLDAGKSWFVALEDTSSPWVSEHSCAFGLNGHAYFVSEASKVIDGQPHHSEGVTRIFVSSDAGRTWNEGARTSWADYSASVVDINAGPGQDKLFIFFNTSFTKPLDDFAAKNHSGTRVGLFTYRYDEANVTGPIAAESMAASGFRGSYPQKIILRKDGSLVCVYRATLRTSKEIQVVLDAVRLRKDHKSFDDPVTVVRNRVNREQPCFIDDAEAYDESRDRIYAAFHEPAKCGLMLTHSGDGGRTWSVPHQVRLPRSSNRGFHSPAMAFNRNGTLGLMWRDQPGSDCWYFSYSQDEGKSFSLVRPLSRACFHPSPARLSDAFCWTFIAQAGSLGPNSPITVDVRNTQEQLWRYSSSLASSPDGRFHAVWVERGNGEGQLRAASLALTEDANRETSIRLNRTDFSDISPDMVVLFGGSQSYDRSSATFTLRVALRNAGTRPIQSPVLLQLEALGGEFGRLRLAKFGSGTIDGKQFWDFSNAIPKGVLDPGTTSQPYPLSFRLAPNQHIRVTETKLLSLSVRVLVRRSPS